MTYQHTKLTDICDALGGWFTLAIWAGVWHCNGIPGPTLDEAIHGAMTIVAKGGCSMGQHGP